MPRRAFLGLAYPLIIFYCLGVPLMTFLVLYAKRESLFLPQDPNKPVIRDSDGSIVLQPNPETAKVYGALYTAYSQELYWWEVVELLRKLALTGLVLLIQPGTAVQLVA